MRVLGIDPGSNITGYGIIEKNGQDLHTLKWGAIRAKKNDSFPEKLRRVYDSLRVVINSYGPSIAVIENIFFAKNPNSALKLGQVRGATILAAVNSGLDIAEYTPLEIKLSITGYGRADKKQVQSMVTKLLCLKKDPKPFDASDALAVAICHIHSAPFINKVNPVREL